MKKYSLSLLATFVFFSSYCQNEQEEIKNAFFAYFNTIKLSQNEQRLSFIHPKCFDYYSKDYIIKVLTFDQKDSTKQTTYKAEKINKISPIEEFKGTKYTLINFTYFFTVKYQLPNEVPASGEIKSISSTAYLDVMETVYKDMYGERKVKFNRSINTFYIQVDEEMFCIKEPNMPGWKFLDKKEEYKEIIEEVIPDKIILKL